MTNTCCGNKHIHNFIFYVLGLRELENKLWTRCSRTLNVCATHLGLICEIARELSSEVHCLDDADSAVALRNRLEVRRDSRKKHDVESSINELFLERKIEKTGMLGVAPLI